MLLRLVIFRLAPLAAVGFVKDGKTIKSVMKLLVLSYLLLFFAAVWKLLCQEAGMALIYLPLSVLPHYLFYMFAIWLMIQCIWKSWSERVWKRIYFLSVLSTILGILTENYINPQILRFFFKIFK